MNAEDFLALTQLNAEYASAVDAGDWEAWIGLFTEACIYRVVPRENHERGFPLATLAFEGLGMLRDRAYAIRETLFHDPYYQRHVVGLPRLLGPAGVDELQRVGAPEGWRVEVSYAVFRTKLSQPSTVFNVGRYLDTVVRGEAGLRLASRECIYDSEMIPNSLIYPI
jgi:salicylate 5-hydroxylase small subunit